MYRRRRAAVVGVLALVAAGIVLAIVLSGSSTPPPHPAATTPTERCPLTDLPAPNGHVPQRPALAVKIGNEESARPQSGLNEADIVYDTPAEGFVMRYMAVYQCGDGSSIGPTRSVRWVDWHILQAFGHSILAFAGGINPNLEAIAHLTWVSPANLLTGAASAGTRITSRVPPDNLYTNTQALWKLYPSLKTPPPAVFSYGSSLPSSATTASSVGINFSTGTDVVWKWDASTKTWLHFYGAQADIDQATHQQVSATNIVIQIVTYHLGPYIESTGGSGDVESQTTGSGSGYVLRDGKSIKVTWHRTTTASPTTFTDSAGQQVTLSPGRTWVELVLNVVAAGKGAITITP